MAEKKAKPYILKKERVVDDIFWNLAKVDRVLDVEQLHEAIEQTISDEGLPINMEFLDAQWKVDPDEKRKRIMVSLKDHLWRNIKIIIGLDYMGSKKSWLQIQMLLVDDPYFTKILFPKKTGIFWAILSILLMTYGALYIMPYGFIADALGLVSLWYYLKTKHKAFKINQERSKQIDKFVKEIDMKSNRTFKSDDVRLFAGAMKKVMLMTIDKYLNEEVEIIDTVSKGGGFFGGLTGGAKD